jgi:hypothetical protein
MKWNGLEWDAMKRKKRKWKMRQKQKSGEMKCDVIEWFEMMRTDVMKRAQKKNELKKKDDLRRKQSFELKKFEIRSNYET